MKKQIRNSILFLLAFVFAAALLSREVVKADASCGGECVMEVSSRRILAAKNADISLPMASTTKILTAILILEDCDREEMAVVPPEAERTGGSSVYLRAGEQWRVRDLLYGLMLRSGNDCAVTLACHHSGSVEAFAQAMNEKALSLGAVHSHFTNPHGLPDPEHYTTALDLALISCYAMENEGFREIVSCKFYEPYGWQNKNKMLFRYEGAIGVKTGFTTAAGRCLVTCAEREGMMVVSVVLNCADMYERTVQLLDDAFANYQLYLLCDRTELADGFRILYDFRYPLKKTELRALRFSNKLSDPLPQKSGEVAGQMEIYLENSLLFSQNLYMI